MMKNLLLFGLIAVSGLLLILLYLLINFQEPADLTRTWLGSNFGFPVFLVVGMLGKTDTFITTTTTTPVSTTSCRVTKDATIWWEAQNKESDNDNEFLCTGAIVVKDHVLTHPKCIECTNGKDIRVALGKNDLTCTDGNDEYSTVKTFTVLNEGGMALIQTTEEIFLADAVAKLREEPPDTTAKCYVRGWKNGTHAWEAHEVSYVPHDICKKDYEGTGNTLAEGAVCATYTEGNNGIIGMPMFCDGELTGIFSQSHMEGQLPAQFAGVHHWRKRIQDQINLNRGAVAGSPQMIPLVSSIVALLLFYKAIV